MIIYKGHYIKPTYTFNNGKADWEIWWGSEENQEFGWTEPNTTIEAVYESIDLVQDTLRTLTEEKI